MQFSRIGRSSVTEEIIEYLKGQILAQELKPGQQLPSEESLAAQLGVGRGTVREALRVLVYLGFIDRRGKSTYVTSIAAESNLPGDFLERIHQHRDVMKVIEVRKIVEPEAAALAAGRGDAEEIAEIGRHLDAMEKHAGGIDQFAAYDQDYHLALFRASGNHILLELMKSIQQLMRQNLLLILRFSPVIKPRSLDFHRRIYDAVREGRDEEARAIMRAHILDIEGEMVRIIKGESGEARADS